MARRAVVRYGIIASGDGTMVPEWRGDALQTAPAFDPVPNVVTDSAARVVRMDNGMFVNRTASVPNAAVSSTTEFRRLVTAQYLCMDAAGTVDVRAASAGCGSEDVAGPGFARISSGRVPAPSGGPASTLIS